MRYLFKALPLLATCAAGMSAQLVFDQPTFFHRASQGETMMTADFSFKNIGTQPIRIVEVKPECGCTTAILDKQIYSPGELGSVHTRLALPESDGVITKTIMIRTDESINNKYTLKLVAQVSSAINIYPEKLYWRSGGPANDRTVTVTFPDEADLELLSATVDRSLFKVTPIQMTSMGHGILTISPLMTARAADAALILLFRSKSGTPIKKQVALRILPDGSEINPINKPSATHQ